MIVIRHGIISLSYLDISFLPGISNFVTPTHRIDKETGQYIFHFGSADLSNAYEKEFGSSETFGLKEVSSLLTLVDEMHGATIINELMLHCEKLVRHFMENHLNNVYQKLPKNTNINLNTDVDSKCTLMLSNGKNASYRSRKA